MIYEKTTESITVKVEPTYLEDQSSPDEGRFVWAYKIMIENNGQRTVKLLSRYWRITDSTGSIQEIEGEGVVGQQPVLRPGDRQRQFEGAGDQRAGLQPLHPRNAAQVLAHAQHVDHLAAHHAPRARRQRQPGHQLDRKSTRLNSSHTDISRMPSSA